jgi:hypothetical protein
VPEDVVDANAKGFCAASRMMTDTELPDEILASRKCSAAEALRRAPARPGYYAIFVDSPNQLQSPFSNLLLERRTRLIYIGIATKSLRQRLVEQDLLHRQPSTFFRGIGAILGFRPSPGSLFGKSNQTNYKFSPEDTKQIIAWIDEHLSVSWIEADPAIEEVERGLIRKHFPIINTDDNPKPVLELAALRRECRMIARADCRPNT